MDAFANLLGKSACINTTMMFATGSRIFNPFVEETANTKTGNKTGMRRSFRYRTGHKHFEVGWGSRIRTWDT
jgi:hypothetical protein